MFSQVSVILSTGVGLGGYHWYQDPTGVGFVVISGTRSLPGGEHPWYQVLSGVCLVQDPFEFGYVGGGVMSREGVCPGDGYIQGWVGTIAWLLTPSAGHHRYSWQVDGMHPTRMFSCVGLI